MNPVSQHLRYLACSAPTPDDDSLMGWFGYFTPTWVVILARLPSDHLPGMAHWALATDDERRMFMLFVAEELE